VQKTYKQLTLPQRHTIEVMKQAGETQAEIARSLGCAPATISRELKRNRDGCGGYEHAYAQSLRDARRARRQSPHAATQAATPVLIHCLEQGITPGQAEMLKLGVSERTCYRLIARDRANGGELYRHLPRGRRPRSRVCRWRRGPIPRRRDISQRPPGANHRSRYGHWEADLVEGKNRASYLLVLRERKSRLCVITRLRDKEAASVRAAVIRELQPFAKSYRSLTMDNGGEFAQHEQMAKALGKRGSTYFTRPYRASDKGSIEELNGRIRRRHPKGTDFREIEPQKIKALQDHLNMMPMRVLGGQKPIDHVNRLIEAC
jgi:transposase, IS30 family